MIRKKYKSTFIFENQNRINIPNIIKPDVNFPDDYAPFI